MDAAVEPTLLVDPELKRVYRGRACLTPAEVFERFVQPLAWRPVPRIRLVGTAGLYLVQTSTTVYAQQYRGSDEFDEDVVLICGPVPSGVQLMRGS